MIYKRPACRSRKILHEVAAEWVLNIAQDPGLRHSGELKAWLAQDPENEAAFTRAEVAWQLSPLAGREIGRSVARPRVARGASRFALASAVGLCFATLVGTVWIGLVRHDLWRSMTADYATLHSEQRQFSLPDGSHVELDAGSALDFASDAMGRHAVLHAGTGYFDILPDGRPFTVTTEDIEIRVLGTRFDLRRQGNATVVTLAEGSVEAEMPSGKRLRLVPGQQLTIRPGASPDLREVSPDEELAWRSGRFTFYDTPLSEVVAVLERHGAGKVVIYDDALAARRITGSLSLSSSADELAILAEGLMLNRLPLPGFQILSPSGQKN